MRRARFQTYGLPLGDPFRSWLHRRRAEIRKPGPDSTRCPAVSNTLQRQNWQAAPATLALHTYRGPTMNRADDPFDTYLLRVLCTLIAERSVSRTAIRMNQSQPAISSALKRLRAIFNDPLLTREKNVMVPTERAIQLAQSAQAAL